MNHQIQRSNFYLFYYQQRISLEVSAVNISIVISSTEVVPITVMQSIINKNTEFNPYCWQISVLAREDIKPTSLTAKS